MSSIAATALSAVRTSPTIAAASASRSPAPIASPSRCLASENDFTGRTAAVRTREA